MKKRIMKILVFLAFAALLYSSVKGGVGFVFNNIGSENSDESIKTNILVQDSHLEFREIQQKPFIATFENILTLKNMEEKTSFVYTIDKTAFVDESILDFEKLLATDTSAEITGAEPKVLIFHTHSQEDFIDSRAGEGEDTIVGVGKYLAEILASEYGVSVVHDIGSYDMLDGKLTRGTSYENMEPAVKKILEKYPTIEVVMDLHRDGVPDNIHLSENIDGKETAKIMFFNGVTCYNDNGKPQYMPELENPYLQQNLALSLKLFLTANELYPGFARKNYIKPYRYSLHLKPLSTLVEVGANTNTVEEAKNAMEPLARIIVETLGR